MTVTKRRSEGLKKKTKTINSNSSYDVVIINYNVIKILIILRIPSIIFNYLNVILGAIIGILLIGMDESLATKTTVAYVMFIC